MRRPISLALRMTLLFGIAAAVVFPFLGWFIVQSTEQHFREQDSEELNIIADAVHDVLSTMRGVEEHNLLRFEDILVGHHDAALYVAALTGHVVYVSPTPDLAMIAKVLQDRTKDGSIHLWNESDHSYRVLIQSTDKVGKGISESYTLAIAVPIDDHLRFLADFRRNLWLMITGCIVLISLMGWFAVRQGHAPLHDIIARIRRISADELDMRLSPENVPGELVELAVSFNEMLHRVDQSFHRLSDFNADIAHELRTPIANLMTQTQVGLSRARNTAEYREILYSNMEEYERMAQMVGDMLYLAQADARQLKQTVAEVDLAQEIHALFDYYEGWAEERGVSLVLEGTSTVPGDRVMLQRALGNLLSNAIRHTASGGTVRVKVNRSTAGEVRIVVENPGDTIPPEHVPRLFDRFYRVDPSRQQGDDGVGLGLAIVKSIINAHDGTVAVESARECTRFIVALPAPSFHLE